MPKILKEENCSNSGDDLDHLFQEVTAQDIINFLEDFNVLASPSKTEKLREACKEFLQPVSFK